MVSLTHRPALVGGALAAALLTLLLSGHPRAARRGRLGRSSSGQARITLTIAPRIRISGFHTLAAAPRPDSARLKPAPLIVTGCVYSSSGAYRVRPLIDQRGRAELTGGAEPIAPDEEPALDWTDGRGATARLPIGRRSPLLDAAGATLGGCGEHPNVRLTLPELKIPPPGRAEPTRIVTLMLSPE